MSREEAIKTLKENYCAMCAYGSQDMDSCDIRSCDNKDAIKALEQESCEDCISREAALKALMDEWTDFDSELMDYLIEKVRKLPPVTAQQKMGRWIEYFDQIGKWYECDQCHTDWGGSVNYCPNCGAKMQEVEE